MASSELLLSGTALLLRESAAAAPELYFGTFPHTRNAASPLPHMNSDKFSPFNHHPQFHLEGVTHCILTSLWTVSRGPVVVLVD